MLSAHRNKNKSRIPMPITSQQRHNKKVNKAVVTPAKLDQKKNNNKSSLFSTTCFRMAQEARNYNKPYIRSEHSHKKSPPLLSSLTTTNKMNKNIHKSPITRLKEDLETWRQKKLDDELLVQKQSNAILKLKQQLALQTEIQQERQRKAVLQSKLKAITAEIESLSMDVVDSLDVKTTLDQHVSYTDTIKELQSQLESREADFKRKLGQYQRELQHKEQCIQQQQATRKQLQRDHADHIAQLNTAHTDHTQTLQAQYQKEAATMRTLSKPSISSIDVSSAIEQALNEFEQEQHNHAPSSPPPTTTCTPLIYHPVTVTALAKTNQQWYSKRYMPIDAVSWPVPQAAPNLKRQIRI
ncbi:uncharacterized protein ATC70_004809 [Mucor velutinosus]|uniref:Uncharacterized protein n=1 Tax=Mucor velutinosus TaxID=708070 RepID=A0AAN7HK65_9FUNG|nr:hypothetical protein ATC70_004809 [Mucor velutinosus]